MSEMTEKMTKAGRTSAKAVRKPKQGDQYRCQACGMELEITADCKCKDSEHVHFQCCGQEMAKI
jgi:hypothetical protein